MSKSAKIRQSERSVLIWGSLTFGLFTLAAFVLLSLGRTPGTPDKESSQLAAAEIKKPAQSHTPHHAVTPALDASSEQALKHDPPAAEPQPVTEPEPAAEPASAAAHALANQQPALAVVAAQEVMDEQGASLQSLDELGTALQAKGDEAQAIYAYEQALGVAVETEQQKGRQLSIEMRLISLYMKSGLRDKARLSLESLESKLAEDRDSPYGSVLQGFRKALL